MTVYRQRLWSMRMAIVVGALLSLAGVTVASPEPVAAASNSAPVVFIVDASGSMVRESSTSESRMQVAKTATIETIEALPSSSEVGMLVFGTGTGSDESERAAGCQDVVTLAPLGPLDSAGLTASVESITPSGFTPIGPALRAAVDMIPAGKPGNIVLISDGVDTCAPPTSCEVASQLHREHPLISIHVVAFDVDDDEAVKQQMSCIGGVGGGTTVQASNATQLAYRLRAAANPSAMNLTGRGLRGVELGMSLDEVRNRVDGAKVGDVEVIDGVEIVYVDCGWGTVELRNNRVWAITPSQENAGTAEGFASGSTLADIEAVYGAAVDSGTADGISNVYPVAPGSANGYRVFYDPSTTKITRIILCRCVPLSIVSTRLPDWEISFDGVGPLTLGMTTAEAKAAMPSLAQEDGIGRWAFYDVDGRTALDLTFVEDRLAKIQVGDEWDENPWGAGLPHARGLRIGDTGATARNTFPGGSYFSVVVSAEKDYVVTNREGRALSFGVGGYDVVADTLEERVNVGPITSISVEDASLLRTDAAFDYLYGM